MKTTTRLLALNLSLGIAACSAAAQTLLREDFDQPTGVVYAYPGPTGSGYRSHLNGRLDAWSGGGVLELGYLAGIGAGGTGGIRLAVAKTTDVYHCMNVYGITLGVTGNAIKPSDLQKLKIEFSALVPRERTVAVALLIDGGNEDATTRWDHRLTLPLLSGTGANAFETYSFDGTNFDADSIDQFLQLARTRGGNPVKVKLHFLLNNAATWKVGEGIVIDELEIKSVR